MVTMTSKGSALSEVLVREGTGFNSAGFDRVLIFLKDVCILFLLAEGI
jgi:hypothetical protein